LRGERIPEKTTLNKETAVGHLLKSPVVILG
jgi:hypothetical protein